MAANSYQKMYGELGIRECVKWLKLPNDSGRRLSRFNLGKAMLLVNSPETKHFFMLELKK